jgi:TetR/AcrR family transcriptional regulator, transcriptional repressor for nem operon
MMMVSLSPSKSSDTRRALLEAGAKLFLEQGYNHTGLEAILTLVGVPKGSFYYYFASKEAFALEVLEHYKQFKFTRMDRYFNDLSLTPLNRIRANMWANAQEFYASDCKGGCLYGRLSAELASSHPAFRKALEGILVQWKAKHRHCFQLAQLAGELPLDMDLSRLVDAYFMMIEGAIISAKVTRTDEGLRVMDWLFFSQLSQPFAQLPDEMEEQLKLLPLRLDPDDILLPVEPVSNLLLSPKG